MTGVTGARTAAISSSRTWAVAPLAACVLGSRNLWLLSLLSRAMGVDGSVTW